MCTLVPAVSLAQTPGDRDLIRERQERLLQEQERRLDELRQLPGKVDQLPAQPVTEDERCFAIKQINLVGATLLSAADQASILKPYSGQCLGVGQLNQLLKDITNHYLGRGYVTTRAYLPQQDLSTGHLQVLVVEGDERIARQRARKQPALPELHLLAVQVSQHGQRARRWRRHVIGGFHQAATQPEKHSGEGGCVVHGNFPENSQTK